MRNDRKNTYSPVQRVLALIGVIGLFGLAASALFVALFGGPERTGLVFRLLAAAVFLPILLWLLIWALGKAKTPGAAEGKEEEEDGKD